MRRRKDVGHGCGWAGKCPPIRASMRRRSIERCIVWMARDGSGSRWNARRRRPRGPVCWTGCGRLRRIDKNRCGAACQAACDPEGTPANRHARRYSGAPSGSRAGWHPAPRDKSGVRWNAGFTDPGRVSGRCRKCGPARRGFPHPPATIASPLRSTHSGTNRACAASGGAAPKRNRRTW